MNIRIPTLLLAALCAASAPAQDPVEKSSESKSGTSQTSTKALIQQLGDSNYQVRRSAEAALRQQGKSALDALADAAKNHTDEEVRWRARRLHKQIDAGADAGGDTGGDARALRKRAEPPATTDTEPMPPRRPRVFMPFGGGGAGINPDLDQTFNEMFERMEREFGIDIPRQRFFQNDFFKDLDRQMEDLRKQSGPGSGSGQSMQMNVGPDGVKVQIQQKGADGKSETKTYEAPSLEEFKAKYPDVARQYLDGGGMGLRLGVPRWRAFGGNPDFQIDPGLKMDDVPDVATEPVAEVPAGERLGVYVEPISEDLSEHMGLQGGEGLRVKSLQSGSLAEKLGIAEGDVLLTIAGKPIRTTQDVRSALRGIAAGAKVEVRVTRRDKELTLFAEKIADAKAQEPSSEPTKELKKKGKKKTEIR